MATTAAKAIRSQNVRTRLDGSLGRLEKRLGVASTAVRPPIPLRDPQLRAIWELEQLADRVDALDAALKDEGYSAAAGRTRTQASEGAVDLSVMSRADLNAYAADLGITDVDKLPNKDAVIERIEQVDQDTAPDAPESPETGVSTEEDS